MSKLFLLFLIVLACLFVAAPVQAASVYGFGYAVEDNGARCSTDCQAVMYSHDTNSGYGPATVESGLSSCGGLSYNWGNYNAYINGVRCPAPNPLMFASGVPGSLIDAWIRHSCGAGSGFYYSPHKSVAAQSSDINYWYGVQQLQKPAGGCFTATPPLGAIGTLAIAAGLGA